MPEYLAPGVYIEEIATGPVPIEGVSTSTAGFVGAAERGPEYARLITSWLAFQRWYGGYIPDRSFLAYAVQGFFDNGGQRCYVTRVVGAGATPAQLDVGNLTAMAVGRGEWGENVMIEIANATQPGKETSWFAVHILYYSKFPVNPPSTVKDLGKPGIPQPDVLESYDNLTFEDGATNNVVTVINSASRLIRIFWQDGAQHVRPVAPQPLNRLTNGNDGADLAAPDFNQPIAPIVSQAFEPREPLGRGSGLQALAAVDDVSLLVVPDEVRNGMRPISEAVINQCELLKDRFGIISVAQGRSDEGAVAPIPARDTSYAAFYYPWIWVFDPSLNDVRLIPATGHIAGIYARTDIERGVHKAPANEVVRDAQNLEFPITKGMQDVLNPKGVNCIRDFRPDGRGIRLWGARTLSSDGQWKYVNVRRLFLFVEESIDEGTQWVVFEPNDEPTWARVRRSITNFLLRVWRDGALMGTTQDEAFFVRCDRTTMTQDDIDNGRLICYIGMAPVKPAEFVIFRFSQKTSEAPS